MQVSPGGVFWERSIERKEVSNVACVLKEISPTRSSWSAFIDFSQEVLIASAFTRHAKFLAAPSRVLPIDSHARPPTKSRSLARSLARDPIRSPLSFLRASSTLLHRFFARWSFFRYPRELWIGTRDVSRVNRPCPKPGIVSIASKPRPYERSIVRPDRILRLPVHMYVYMYIYIYACVCTFSRVCARIMCTVTIYSDTRFILLIRALFLLRWPFSKSRERTKDWSGRGTSIGGA